MRLDLGLPVDTSAIPALPGVYLFLDGAGAPLYVGKAKDLRRRLASYLGPGRNLPDKTRLLVERARLLEITITPSEEDALVLEARLIRRLRPRYNIRLRDDKAYPMIRIGLDGPFPRAGLARRREGGRARYFGPYPSARSARERLRLVASVFGIRGCSDSQFRSRRRPCLQHQIGRCSAPCCGLVGEEEYAERLHGAILFLEGRSREVVKQLRQEMEAASEALEFERAAVLRDRIRALEWSGGGLLGSVPEDADMDVVGLACSGDHAVAALIEVRSGVVQGELELELNGGLEEGEAAFLRAFLLQWYAERPIPAEVVLPFALEGAEYLLDGLSARRGGVRVKTAVRGFRKRLIEMAAANAAQGLEALLRSRDEWEETARLLADLLGLDSIPTRIEGVDISNTGGGQPVGSFVVFVSGRPEKRDYRRYNLDYVPGPDDFAMIEEAVRRRLSARPLPDLLLVDGGKGQLAAASRAVAGAGLSEEVALAAIAKDKGRGYELLLSSQGREVEAPPRVMFFIQRVRDEAHRFGITAHRLRRSKASLRSRLMEVEGIGPKRLKTLLERFGSPARAAEASEEEIASLPGFSMRLARRVKEALAG